MAAQDQSDMTHQSFHASQAKDIPNYEEQQSDTTSIHSQDNSSVHTLLSWHAPSRPYIKRRKEFYLNVVLITILLLVIGFLFNQGPLMLVIISFAFCVCTLYLVPPHESHYRISTEGIRVDDKFYLWQEMYDFYIRRMHGQDVVVVRVDDYVLTELFLLAGALHVEQIKQVLIQTLPYREYVKPSFVEKSGNWLAENFPLERS